jgi:hypothetical protein
LRRVKLELRRGLLFGPRLQSIACNALGFYLYLVLRKPFGGDCVFLATSLAAADFGVHERSIRKWLEELAAENLAWHHRRQHDLCIHILKAGDHAGDDWKAATPTHQDRRPVRPQTPGLSPAPNARTGPFSPARTGRSVRPQTPGLGGALFLPQESTPRENPPGAAAPRTPDGARGVAPAEHAVPCPPDVMAESHRLGRKIRAEA